jgi:hypothetical protein
MKFFGIFSLLLTSVINVNSYFFKEAETSVWLSGAAYCNKENYMDMNLAGSASGFIVTNILYDKATDLQGYIGIMPQTKTIYVTFRGSSSVLNWIDDFKLKKIPYDSYPECNCSVHDGFYTTTLHLKSSVIININILKKKYKYNNVIVTGHSLGAAIAQLMMMELNLNNIYSTVYNYGQPRVGDIDYANFVSLFYKEQLYRYTHYKDIVPHIPPNEMKYYHSCNEIYENENGDLYNCSTTNCEDPLCSDQFLLKETNTYDHSIYLGHYLSCEESTK